MLLSRSLHPPGGAFALVACIGSEEIKKLGFFYVLVPVLSGSLIFLALAVLLDNMTALASRQYPRRWLPWDSALASSSPSRHTTDDLDNEDSHDPVLDAAQGLALDGARRLEYLQTDHEFDFDSDSSESEGNMLFPED